MCVKTSGRLCLPGAAATMPVDFACFFLLNYIVSEGFRRFSASRCQFMLLEKRPYRTCVAGRLVQIKPNPSNPGFRGGGHGGDGGASRGR